MHAQSLNSIREGMKVYDAGRHEIGKVEWVKLSEDDPATPEVESASPPVEPDADGGIIGAVAEAFHPDDLPEEIRDHLMQQGFVRIDANGLFAADRYVTPDQIASVGSDSITLSVNKDDLVKRH